MEVYLVGGAVRDQLLGLPVRERDWVVVGARPEDLERRDLMINAMAQAPSGEIIDPYGGQQDLQARVLRHVSEAFVEDPVRILRLARFAARFADLGFSVAEETLTLMRKMVRCGEADALVPERV